MVLLAPFMILVYLGGSFGGEYEESCFYREQGRCESQRQIMFSSEYPETSEDLMKRCQLFQKVLSCLEDVRAGCDVDDDKIAYIRDAISYLSSTCEEDNPTFKVISNNLNCVTRVSKMIGNRPCTHTFSRKGFDALMDASFHFYEREFAGSKFLDCLGHVEETTCVSATFEHHCGIEVRDAVSEVLLNVVSKPGTDSCTPEMLDELEPYNTAFKAIMEEELELQDSLEKKRK